MAALQNVTLAERAYRKLRQRIVQGELPAGRRLLPEELGAALSISPTPIKEALAMLQRDGLIEVEARRGSAVRRFSARDIGELYDARCMVEARAITVGLREERVTAAFLTRFAACAALYAERSGKRSRNDLRLALRHDHDLHTLLTELAANRLLSEWHQRLLRQTQLVRVYSLSSFDAGRLEQAGREHAAILAGLRAGEAHTAVTALEAHLATSLGNVLSNYA